MHNMTRMAWLRIPESYLICVVVVGRVHLFKYSCQSYLICNLLEVTHSKHFCKANLRQISGGGRSRAAEGRKLQLEALFYRVHFSFRGPSPHPRPRHRADRLRGAAGVRQHGVQPARRHQVDRGRSPAVRNSERGAKIFHDKAKIFGTPSEVCLESDFLCNQLVMEQATSPLWLINCRAYLNTRVPNEF